MYDVHYWPTPNGKKVTILLEELGAPYKVVPCNIGRGDQFTADFLKMNPNHRMPVLVDHDPSDGGEPIAVFESGAIMMYIAEKEGKFFPQATRPKYQVTQWLIWQMANQGPKSGECGHFRRLDASKGDQTYAVTRFTDEANWLYGVLNNRLHAESLAGRRRIQHCRYDLLSVDGELEGARPGHRGVQILQALVRGDGRAAGRAARHGGRRRSVRGPVQAAAGGARPAGEDPLQPARPAGAGVAHVRVPLAAAGAGPPSQALGRLDKTWNGECPLAIPP